MTRSAIVPTLVFACLLAFAPVSAQSTMVQEQVVDFKADLAQYISSCWNVDPGSESSKVTVAVGFTIDRDGNVFGSDVRLISSDGDRNTTPRAFQTARRAVLRCMTRGYQLPDDHNQEWTDVVITFSPVEIQVE